MYGGPALPGIALSALVSMQLDGQVGGPGKALGDQEEWEESSRVVGGSGWGYDDAVIPRPRHPDV